MKHVGDAAAGNGEGRGEAGEGLRMDRRHVEGLDHPAVPGHVLAEGVAQGVGGCLRSEPLDDDLVPGLMLVVVHPDALDVVDHVPDVVHNGLEVLPHGQKRPLERVPVDGGLEQALELKGVEHLVLGVLDVPADQHRDVADDRRVDLAHVIHVGPHHSDETLALEQPALQQLVHARLDAEEAGLRSCSEPLQAGLVTQRLHVYTELVPDPVDHARHVLMGLDDEVVVPARDPEHRRVADVGGEDGGRVPLERAEHHALKGGHDVDQVGLVRVRRVGREGVDREHVLEHERRVHHLRPVDLHDVVMGVVDRLDQVSQGVDAAQAELDGLAQFLGERPLPLVQVLPGYGVDEVLPPHHQSDDGDVDPRHLPAVGGPDGVHQDVVHQPHGAHQHPPQVEGSLALHVAIHGLLLRLGDGGQDRGGGPIRILRLRCCDHVGEGLVHRDSPPDHHPLQPAVDDLVQVVKDGVGLAEVGLNLSLQALDLVEQLARAPELPRRLDLDGPPLLSLPPSPTNIEGDAQVNIVADPVLDPVLLVIPSPLIPALQGVHHRLHLLGQVALQFAGRDEEGAQGWPREALLLIRTPALHGCALYVFQGLLRLFLCHLPEHQLFDPRYYVHGIVQVLQQYLL
eukprot:335694-Hanusia_phi.AAC.15